MSRFGLRRQQERLSSVERWLENGMWLAIGLSALGSWWWAITSALLFVVRAIVVRRLEAVNYELRPGSS